MPFTTRRLEGRQSEMSEKKVKEDRKLKLMTEEAGLMETAKEQARSIAKMYEDRDKKAIGAKEHLISQLMVTADKYRTANGVMSALDTVRLVFGGTELDIDEQLDIARATARRMAGVAQAMAAKVEILDPEQMSVLCDGFYAKEFADSKATALDMVDELMTLQLCQNVGSNAQDVEDFCAQADDEIEKARENLRTFCTENDINFTELCGPHDNCPDCLCMSCQNECKDHKYIEEGQSAYDVCEKFVEQK